jgi:hypothetical protein
MSICVVNKTSTSQNLTNGGSIEPGQTMCLYLVNNTQQWSIEQPQGSSKVTPDQLPQDQSLISQVAPGSTAPSSAYTFPDLKSAQNFSSAVAAAPNNQLTVVVEQSSAANGGDREDPNKTLGEIVKEGPSYT